MSSHAPAQPHLEVQPLRCARCGSPIPLGEAEQATCPFCGEATAVPEPLRRLREARRREGADRAQAAALSTRLGEPPGAWLQLWAQAADLVGGALAVLVALLAWVGGISCLLGIFLLEFAAHWLARPLGVDLADLWGGFGLYARFAAALLLFAVLPWKLRDYFEARVGLRRRVQAGLAARFPEREGGPSLCRNCGAPLDVPRGVLGVACLYCGADNLVALPRAWVARAEAHERGLHERIAQAAELEAKQRKELRADLRSGAGWLLALVPAFGLVGKVATWIDYEAGVPSFAETLRPERHAIDKDRKAVPLGPPGLPYTRYYLLSVLSDRLYVGLHKGEVVSFQSVTPGPGEFVAHSNTTFPLGQWEEAVPWKQVAGGYAAWFKAPYTGVFGFTGSIYALARGESRLTISVGQEPPAPRAPARPPELARREWKAHAKQVEGLAWSHDGAHLASASTDATAAVWDPASGTELLRLKGHGARVVSAAFRPDGSELATASEDRTVRVWGPDGVERARLELPAKALSVAYRPDGATLAAGDDDGLLRLFDAAHGYARGRDLKGHRSSVNGLAWSPDGALLLSGAFDATARLWDPASGKQLRGITPGSSVYAVAFLPGREAVLLGAKADWSAWGYGQDDDGELAIVAEHGDAVYAVTATPGGEVLATGSHDQTVRLWDGRTGLALYTLGPLGASVETAAFSPDGRSLAAGLADGRVLLWALPPGGAWAAR